jgi:hypothetical protein
MRHVADDERAWLQNVIGALAVDSARTAARQPEVGR